MQSSKHLYNQIMRRISNSVKRILNEDMHNFDVADYEDDGIIDSHTIHTIVYYKYFPETRNDLKELVIKRVKQNPQNPYLLDIDTSKITSMHELFWDGGSSIFDKIEELDLSGWNTSNVTDMSHMFLGLKKLKKLDISNFNTSNVYNMESMFLGNYCLTELDLSSFDTSNVLDMSSMFKWCGKLMELDLSHFNTSKTTNMENMFCGCKSLTELDLSSFDTSKITSLFYMFNECKSLKNLDLSNFDTSNVTTMYCVFLDCKSLKTLNLSNWDTLNVTDMYNMFSGCRSLKEINLVHFDTRNVKRMDEMFAGCRSLKKLDLSNFNTCNVTTMRYMFSGCYKLSELNLANWNTSKVNNMQHMFGDCKLLKELDLSSFTIPHYYIVNHMFDGCDSLTYINTNNRSIKYAFKNKRILNENLLNFDVVNYGDDDVIDNQEINNIISEMTEEKIEYIIEFTKLMMYDSGGTVHKKINKRFEIYNDFIYNETNNGIKAKKNIFDDPYYWEEVGAGDILDPKHKYKSGISYYINLSYEDKKLIMDAVNPVISDYLLKGFDFSENIKKDKNLFSKLVFELGNLFSRQEYNDRIYVYLHEQTKEIVIENMEYVYMNITSGLEQFDFYGYKILLPVECNIEVSDSYSSSMNIRRVKEAILKVFSRKNKFGIITLKYISFHMSDMGLDFLDKIYADKVEFSTCTGFRTLNIDTRKFINPNTKLEIIAGSGKLKI